MDFFYDFFSRIQLVPRVSVIFRLGFNWFRTVVDRGSNRMFRGCHIWALLFHDGCPSDFCTSKSMMLSDVSSSISLVASRN